MHASTRKLDRLLAAADATGSLARGRRARRARRSRPVRRVGRWLFATALALVLPFFVLLRGSTWLYGTGRFGAWPTLVIGAAATIMLLAGYVLALAWRVRRRFTVPRRLLRCISVLVGAYCAYGLLFLSGAHAKTAAVQAEYRSLHPLLRMATATLVVFDGDLLLTDASRSAADYAGMGLPANEASLHLPQRDGYAHALDLRTLGRSRIRNALTRAYFAALGFGTLRHTGTADHLHVSLPLP